MGRKWAKSQVLFRSPVKVALTGDSIEDTGMTAIGSLPGETGTALPPMPVLPGPPNRRNEVLVAHKLHVSGTVPGYWKTRHSFGAAWSIWTSAKRKQQPRPEPRRSDDLDRVENVVNLPGMINVHPDLERPNAEPNEASGLFCEISGQAVGQLARSSVRADTLADRQPVETEGTFLVRD